jgi:hypothetical protein
MNKQHAIALMLQGQKITHKYFKSHEWIRNAVVSNQNLIIQENGDRVTYKEFFEFRQSHNWDEGYEVFGGEHQPFIKPLITPNLAQMETHLVSIVSNTAEGALCYDPHYEDIHTPTDDDTIIRRLILKDPDNVKRLMLTQASRSMVLTVAQNGTAGVTVNEWSRRFGDSIQCCSQKLKALWQKGYLTREEMVCATGGVYYVYRVAEEQGQ